MVIGKRGREARGKEAIGMRQEAKRQEAIGMRQRGNRHEARGREARGIKQPLTINFKLLFLCIFFVLLFFFVCLRGKKNSIA